MAYPTQNQIIAFFTGTFDTSTPDPLVKADKVAVPDFTGHLMNTNHLDACLRILDGLAAGSGWSPTFAVDTDGDRLVIEVTGWTGGTGTPPATGYLGPSGIVDMIADGINVRGTQGDRGTRWTISDAFPTTDAVMGDVHLFAVDVGAGLTWLDTDGSTSITTATRGDYAQFSGTAWVKQGSIQGAQGQQGPPGATTFIGLTDTVGTFGTPGQATVVNAAGDGLEFDGPFMPLLAPPVPGNFRTTDAFDGRLAMAWNSVADAESYEWQRKLSSDSDWPSGNGTSTTSTSAQNSASLALDDYDLRVRSVGMGGVLRSAWTEITDIPVIATPTPAVPSNLRLTRAGNRALRFSWSDVDVNNGGSGAGRVVKQANYQIQNREVGSAYGNTITVGTSTAFSVSSLTNGQLYEMRVRARATRSDGSGANVESAWSGESNQERPVSSTVVLTYGVSGSRTGVIQNPRTISLTPGSGRDIEITNQSFPVADGQFYVLDVARGDEYARAYNITTLETRPLPTDITAGSSYVLESEPSSGPRRASVGPAVANSQTQIWHVEVN